MPEGGPFFTFSFPEGAGRRAPLSPVTYATGLVPFLELLFNG